jgi:hypothetical protein
VNRMLHLEDRRNTKTVATIVLSVFLACALAIVGDVIHRRKRAETFLRDATSLQLREATLTQVQQLVARYEGRVEPSTCSPKGCGYFFSFDNGWLHRLHLAPRTRLTCTLGVADGFLDYRRVFLTSGNTAGEFGAFVQERLSSPKGIPEPFSISRGWTTRRWRVYVDMTGDATADQHRIAYSLNLECLSKIGGCEDAYQLLPSVTWEQTSPNGVSPNATETHPLGENN